MAEPEVHTIEGAWKPMPDGSAREWRKSVEMTTTPAEDNQVTVTLDYYVEVRGGIHDPQALRVSLDE